MKNPKLISKELSKIEFLVPTKDKETFKRHCESRYSCVASVMKELFYKKLEEIK
jgi:hypothetical protein